MAIYDVNGNSVTVSAQVKSPIAPIFGETALIKHRAGNSASAMATAYSNGYKSVEGDVRFTSDSVPVMSHDATLNGLTISSSTLAQLQAAGTVYTFDDWMLDCHTYNIMAEIDFTKTYTETQCGILAQNIVKAGMTGRCTIECYRGTSATYLSNNSTDLILSILESSSTSNIDLLSTFAAKSRQVIAVIAHDSASSSLVEYAHSKGYLVRIWTGSTSDTVSQVKSYLAMGADFVLTDNAKPSDITPS